MRLFHYLIISTLSVSTITTYANSSHLVTFTNDTPFYLHLQVGAYGTCSKTIAPGTKGSVQGYCGYDACATANFDSNSGCQEFNVDKSNLSSGGYATYFGLNTESASTTCEISSPDGINYVPFKCGIDLNNHFTLTYQSLVQKYSDGPNKGQAVELPKKITRYQHGPLFRGINISGLEYDGTFLDGLFQQPDLPDARYFAEKGMNTIRLPIRWEFILGAIDSKEPDPNKTTVNEMYLSAVYDTVQKYLHSGMSVDLDLHNYMRFCPTGKDIGQANEPTNPTSQTQCQIVTAEQLAAIWNLILTHPIKTNSGSATFAALANQFHPTDSLYSGPQLMFGLMNEPFTRDDGVLNTSTVFLNEVAAIKAIRKSAKTNLILMSGNYWDPLHDWVSHSENNLGSNGEIFTRANLIQNGVDPDTIVIEMHQYFNHDFSGLDPVCNIYAGKTAFEQALELNQLIAWNKTQKLKLFLGEFGAADNSTCHNDLSLMLNFLEENAYDYTHPENGGFIGWTAWRANRHGNSGFGEYTYLQQADTTVYGAPQGSGILKGPGNGLMETVFSKHLGL